MEIICDCSKEVRTKTMGIEVSTKGIRLLTSKHDKSWRKDWRKFDVVLYDSEMIVKSS